MKNRVEVFIQVLDENDNNPVFSSEPDSISINENVSIGQDIGRVKAYDADSGEYGHVTYLLSRVSSQVSETKKKNIVQNTL